MSRSDPPSFHVRLPSELKERLQAVRGSNSLNREIVERLERTFESDRADQLAEALQPLMAMLEWDDQERVIGLAASAVELLVNAKKVRPPR